MTSCAPHIGNCPPLPCHRRMSYTITVLEPCCPTGRTIGKKRQHRIRMYIYIHARSPRSFCAPGPPVSTRDPGRPAALRPVGYFPYPQRQRYNPLPWSTIWVPRAGPGPWPQHPTCACGNNVVPAAARPAAGPFPSWNSKLAAGPPQQCTRARFAAWQVTKPTSHVDPVATV